MGIMKKTIMIFNACLLVAFLAACGAQNNKTNEAQENNQTEENQDNTPEEGTNSDNENKNEVTEEAKNQDDMKKMMDDLYFKKIEIEISYGPNQEYKAEIEYHDNGDIEAEVEDELNDVDINDDLEAFNSIYPKVKQLDVTQDTSKEEVIQQVLSAFDLGDDYEEFEVEITFNDGTKISFED